MLLRENARRGRRVFTGWKVVASSSVVWGLQSMLWMQGYGNLAVELRDRFGWSKTLFSLAFAGTRTQAAVMGPFQGRAIERHGIRLVMRIGAVISAIGFVALSQITTRTQFVAAMAVTTIGMTMIGFLTITAGTVAWFERRRARALSIQSMGFAVGGFAGPIVVVGYRWFGWRWTTAVAGVALAAIAWWAASIVGRSRADTGEPVDGIDPADIVDGPRAEGVQDRHFTAEQAIRTRAFWMISLGHGSALLVVSSSMAHLALYLTEDRDYSAGRAALVAGMVPVFQLIGTGAGGYLGDRINKRLIAGVAMMSHGIGLLLLTWVQHWWAIAAFVVMHGFAWGVRGPQMQAIRADYFGATSFARIMGYSSMIVTMFAVTGPILAGTLADATGDYQLGFTILAIAAMAGSIFWALASPPGDRPAAASTSH